MANPTYSVLKMKTRMVEVGASVNLRAGDAVAPLYSVDELTAEWMTEALRLEFPGVEVTRLQLGPVRHGSESTVRVLLEYNRAGREHRLPATMYVKGQWTSRSLIGILGESTHERRRGSIKTLLHCYPRGNLPKCYFASVGTDHRSTIVMEDLLARNVILGAAGTTVSPVTAYQLAEQFACLHALWFDAPELSSVDWLRKSSPGGFDVEQMAAEENGIFGSFNTTWWDRRTRLPDCEFLPAELLDRVVVKQALINKYRLEVRFRTA